MRFLALLLLFAAAAQDAKPAPVTFTKDVAPIIFNRCASCHRPDEVAPFSLLQYADVKKRAKQIHAAVESRQMPPWKPVEGYGEFVGDRRMSAVDIETVRKWVEQGCAEGDAKDLPPPPKFPEGWLFGEPDLIVKMAEVYTVPEEGREVVRAFVVPSTLTENKYVRAVQLRPRQLRVVHHALVLVDGTADSRKRDEADPEPGFDGWKIGLTAIMGGTLGSLLPGGLMLPFPDGTVKEIRKGSDLVLQIHFNPIGKAVEEQFQIGLWFSREAPKHLLVPVALWNLRIDLPPDQKDLQIKSRYVVPVDVDLIGIQPHAHYLGRECKVWATDPAGKEIPIIWIKDWNFDWQEQYRLKAPIRLTKGTEFTSIWTFDNTTGNPKNPSNPPRRVKHGERSSDEMAVAALQFATLEPGDKMKLYMAMLGAMQEK